VKIVSALPETWLVHLIRMADDDPDVSLVRVAKEEEAIGISAGASSPQSKSWSQSPARRRHPNRNIAAVDGTASCFIRRTSVQIRRPLVQART
jgi:hypothetical protein